MNTRWLVCISLFFTSFVSGFAQQKGLAERPEPPASASPDVANRQITLDVVVADKSGKPIPGLRQQDFTLVDNKQPQKIVSIRAAEGGGATAVKGGGGSAVEPGSATAAEPGSATADEPMEMILLVDQVNTDFTALASARKEIVKFLGRNGGQLALPASMVFLSEAGGTVGETPTRDGNALIAELNQKPSSARTNQSRTHGFYNDRERLEFSVHTLEQVADYEATIPGRKLAIWISSGWPLLSSPRGELGSKAKQWVFDTVVALSDRLRRARITLYDIDPAGVVADTDGLRGLAYRRFLTPVKTLGQALPGSVALQVLASQSGGLVLNSNDVAGEIATCVADASASYALSFDGLPGDGPNEYHALEVTVNRPGLTARTRSGYYAQPERAPAR